MFEERNFVEYKEHTFARLQNRLLIIGYISATIIFTIELSIYLLLLKIEPAVVEDGTYFLIRVLVPTITNFGTLIVVSQIKLRSKKLTVEQKNFLVSIGIFVISSILSIFHSFYQILLISSSIPFFICSVFGDTKILKKIGIMTIPVFIITAIVFWLDEATGAVQDKITTLICDLAFIISSFLFGSTIVKTQAEQLKYVSSTYEKQTELIEELKIEPLTRLYNRNAMDQALKVVIKRAVSSKYVPILVMTDLDFFKKVNDYYGHVFGDEVLITLSGIIKKNMGSSRNAFRYGGEEFVLLFTANTLDSVIETLEDIRLDLVQADYSVKPNKPITLSVGVAVYEEGWDAKQWIENADKALYQAKENGRNQIKIYQGLS